MSTLALKSKLIYATGNLGIAMITGLHMQYLLFYFNPPDNADIPYLISQQTLFAGFTLFGFILGIGKLLDAVIDPIIAALSDRFGKRLSMMRLAALPFAACYLLVFFVPDPTGISATNTLWVACFLILSAISFTSYMIPFYSLMVDIARTSQDKVDLSTISSAFWFVGYLLASFNTSLWGPLQDWFEIDRLSSIRWSFIGAATIGGCMLLVPTFLLKIERGASATSQPVEPSFKLFHSIRKVIANRNFRFYLFANTCYSAATAIFESGLIYFVTVLALMDAGYQGPIVTVIGVATLACYPLVNKLAKSRGPSAMFRLSLVLFTATFLVISAFGLGGIHLYVLLALVLLLTPFSQASFGILPQVITTDCAAHDRHVSEEDVAGMYVAANGFCTKLGGAIGLVLFTSFLLLGKDVGSDMGIRAAAIFAACTSLLAALFLSQYDEQEVQSYNSQQQFR